MAHGDGGYRPGVRNLGHDARIRRGRLAVGGLFGAAGYLGTALLFGLPPTYAAGAYPFFALAATGLLAGRFSFCAGLAVLARYDLRGSGGDVGRVADPAARRRDRVRAAGLLATSLLAALGATVLAYGAAVVG